MPTAHADQSVGHEGLTEEVQLTPPADTDAQRAQCEDHTAAQPRELPARMDRGRSRADHTEARPTRATRTSGVARQYYRPAWNANRINVYGRPFVGYPGWRAYGTYGLTPGLAAYTGLAFLSAGLLIGSYAELSKTVYVYVVNEGGQNVEYRVNSAGNVISKRVVN